MNKNETFQDLWNSLTNGQYLIYNETHGEQYNAIIQETEDSRFELCNVNCDSDNLFIPPSAKVENLEFVDNSLMFNVNTVDGEIVTLYLQVRIAPNIRL